MIYGGGSDEHQNPCKIKGSNRPFMDRFWGGDFHPPENRLNGFAPDQLDT